MTYFLDKLSLFSDTELLNTMDETQQKEQKWGFWLLMLNFFSLDSIGGLLLRKMLDTNETSVSQHIISSTIAISLAFGIRYMLRHQSWEMKVWTSGIIVMISLAAWISSIS